MEKISVIVPVYKVEKFLDQCVSSIVNQSYKNLEIILVDDGSPDGCPAMCDDWAEKDNRIKVIHKENGGLSSARNAGIDVATGEYIAFVDSDDYIDKRMYEMLRNGFEKENIGIVSCGVLYDNNGNVSVYNEKWNVNRKRIVQFNDFGILLLQTKVNFTVWSKLYKRELFENIRFQLNKLNEDSLFIFDLSFVLEKQELDMLELPYNGYYYRYTPGSITNNKKKPLAIDIIDNYEIMSREAYDKEHMVLGKAIMQYRNYKLFSFLFQIMKTPEFHVYFKSYYKKFVKTPVIDLYKANNMGITGGCRLLLLKFFPMVYRIKYHIAN